MFRDIKRDAFHRSHPLVPAMNASTTPVSCLALPPYLPPHTYKSTHPYQPDNHPPRQLAELAYSTRATLSPPSSPRPNGYTPNLQLSQSHRYPTEHAIYYTLGHRQPDTPLRDAFAQG
ncbi:hypothetical protein QLX08_004057 [Tetragonisca angustula]|uniref:Uncharacterized protein n=1 Tax=Tetragonisca angustula TaxID=166442 RepID=A0AAW1A6J2_9HYME